MEMRHVEHGLTKALLVTAVEALVLPSDHP